MRLSDHQKKSAGIGIAIFFLIVAVVSWRIMGSPNEPEPVYTLRRSSPVLLGTNELRIGANLHLQSNHHHFGTVAIIEKKRDWADGTNRLSILVRGTNGFEGWLPREALNKVFVTQ